jgi:hypothetical protein
MVVIAFLVEKWCKPRGKISLEQRSVDRDFLSYYDEI